MLLDRSEVPTQYDTLEVIPLENVSEKLEWTTNIFIAADLSEIRAPLSASPAMTIKYNFNLRCSTRPFLQRLVTSKQRWLIPYLPHLTRGFTTPFHPLLSGGGEVFAVGINNNYYPYKDYYAVWNRQAISYRATHGTTGESLPLVNNFASIPIFDSITSGDYWIAPAVVAIVKPQISYQDLGQYMDGSTITLEFRLTGQSEVGLTYEYDTFDFVDNVERPVSRQVMLPHTVYAPAPAQAHAHVAHARTREQALMSDVTYYLNYDDYHRDDYTFRGYWFKALGSFTAGNYADKTIKHRLANDMITLNYKNGVCKANCKLRQVEK